MKRKIIAIALTLILMSAFAAPVVAMPSPTASVEDQMNSLTDFISSNYRFLSESSRSALARVEKDMGMKFDDPENALLLSCRSGARMSMPGMMETVLNIGLCPKTIPGLIAKTKNERFVYDAYRRLIMMYSDVVMEKAAGVEPAFCKADSPPITYRCN